jgi:hypothetical protein
MPPCFHIKISVVSRGHLFKGLFVSARMGVSLRPRPPPSPQTPQPPHPHNKEPHLTGGKGASNGAPARCTRPPFWRNFCKRLLAKTHGTGRSSPTREPRNLHVMRNQPHGFDRLYCQSLVVRITDASPRNKNRH